MYTIYLQDKEPPLPSSKRAATSRRGKYKTGSTSAVSSILEAVLHAGFIAGSK